MAEPISDAKTAAEVPFGYQFISDRDPGDESDLNAPDTEAHARSGTRSKPAQLPAGF